MRNIPVVQKISLVIFALALGQGCGWKGVTSARDRVRRGDELVAQGKFDDADLQFRRALQKDDRFGEAHLHLGRLLARRDKFAEAYGELSRAADLMPQSDDAQAEFGRLAMRLFLGDPQRPILFHKAADDAAAALLSRDARSFEGLRLRGYLAMAGSHVAQAIEYFREANLARPDQPDVIVVLMQSLMADGQKAEAENLGRRSVTAIRNYGPLYDALYAVYTGSNRTAEAGQLLAGQLLKEKVDNNPMEGFFVVQLAEHYWRQKKLREMDDALQGLILNSRSYPEGLFQAGDFYRTIGDFDKALAVYSRGIASGGRQKEECLQGIVRVYLSQGRKDEAARVLDAILKDHPDDATSLASRADLRMTTGKPEEFQKAVAEFTEATQKKPDDNQIRFGLAEAYRQSGQTAPAGAALQEILHRDPRDSNALRGMAEMAIRSHHADEAVQYAERLIAIDPRDVTARLIRTSAWARMGLFLKVRSELNLLTEAAPNLPEPWIQMATVDLEEKKYDDAERIFRRFYKPGSGDIRPLRGLVSVYQARRHPEQGLALARQEAKLSNSLETGELLATSAAQAGDFDLALATTQKLVSDFPRNTDSLLFAGELYVRKGQLDLAIASFRKAQQMTPGDPLPWAHLGEALGRSGRYSEAVAAGKESLKLRPDDPLAMNNLAWYLAQAGDLNQAGKLARRALQREPGNLRFSDTLAMVDMKEKNFGDARDILQDLIDKTPGNTEYRTHLAMVLIQSGQRAQARNELEAVLRARPSADVEQEIRGLLNTLN